MFERASLFTGLVDWTGLDWAGLTQKSVKCFFQCRTEAKHTYSLKLLAQPDFVSFLESVEVKGHVHIYCRNQTPAFW